MLFQFSKCDICDLAIKCKLWISGVEIVHCHVSDGNLFKTVKAAKEGRDWCLLMASKLLSDTSGEPASKLWRH